MTEQGYPVDWGVAGVDSRTGGSRPARMENGSFGRGGGHLRGRQKEFGANGAGEK